MKKLHSLKRKQDVSYKNEGLLINALKKENETLRKKNDELNDIVLKFTNGQKILDNLLGFQKCVFDKGDIRYSQI